MAEVAASLASGPNPDGGEAHRNKPHRPREWKCGTCHQAFRKKEHLIRHARSHTKEKPFACDVCSKSYGRHDSLIRHARTHAVRTSQHGQSPRQANPSPLSEGNIPLDPGLGQPQPDSSAPFETRLNGSADVSFQNGFSRLGSTSNIFEISPDTHVNVPDAFTNFGSMNLATGIDESFWHLPADFYETLQTFPVPTSLSQNGDIPFGPFDSSQPLGMTRPTPATPEDPSRDNSANAVHEKWYTRPTVDSPSQPQSIGSQDQDKVDETYRAGLSHRLKPTPQDSILPSADFLNLCIKLYFSKFHPVFPIIHAASFRPSSENALLLLSICSIGALFVGSATARARGRGIFLRLNKAILASWELYLLQGGRESLAVAQAVVLGQTFGMLSGSPKDLFLTESFHGTMIAWARQAGIFKVKNALNMVDVHDDSNMESNWRTWIQAEESARVLLALHIHDSEFSAAFHHEPLLRHEPERLPRCCGEAIFAAPTATRWQEIVVASLPPNGKSTPVPDHHSRAATLSSPSLMNAYASLAGIYASISEARSLSLNEETARHLRRSLMLWADSWFADSSQTDSDLCCLTILWHETFMSLYADFDLLERAVGREGASKKDEEAEAVRQWTTSIEGKRCAAHAVLTLKHLESMPLGSEPAIHVPMAAFHAGMVFYSFIQLADSGARPVEFDIPEILTGSQKLARIVGARLQSKGYRIEASTLSALTDLLRRQGHWEISRKFASILEVLVDEIADPGERAQGNMPE